MTTDDRIRLAWSAADRQHQLNRVVEQLTAEGTPWAVLNVALG